MDLNFFIICFGLLASYALLRTVRKGWLRGVIVFFLLLCLIHIGFETLFPQAKYQTAQQASDKRSRVSGLIADTIMAVENDRCIVSHLEETPLSPVAYLMEAHRFLRDYQGQASGGPVTLQQAAGTLFGSQQSDPNSLCDRLTHWVDAQAQGQVQRVIGGQPQAVRQAPQEAVPEPAEAEPTDDQ